MLPVRIPDFSTICRIVVFLYPCATKSAFAAFKIVFRTSKWSRCFITILPFEHVQSWATCRPFLFSIVAPDTTMVKQKNGQIKNCGSSPQFSRIVMLHRRLLLRPVQRRLCEDRLNARWQRLLYRPDRSRTYRHRPLPSEPVHTWQPLVLRQNAV